MENDTEYAARLDARILELADRLPQDEADEIRSGLAYIRETWDGQDGEDQSPAEAFGTIADWATGIAKILARHENTEN